MGSSSEFYNLTWNEFQTTVATSFQDMRSSNEFLDVTLTTDEDHQCQAHKVILSASSPYFRSVLKKNQTAQNPIVVMPANVRYNDLRALLDFVYQGEVKIPIHELDEFLALAKLLKIKGLTEKTEDEANRKTVKPQQPMKMTPGNGVQMGRRRPSGGGQSHPGQTPPPQGLGVGVPPQAKRHRPEQKFASMPPQSQPGPGNVGPPNEELDEDDVHELDEEGNDAMYGEYEEYEGGEDYPMASGAAGPGQQGGPNQQTPQKQAGPILRGLLCPVCSVMVPGADALTAHMYDSHEMGIGGQKTAGKRGGKGGKRGGKGGKQHQPPVDGEPEDKPHACHICDKPFKTQQYVKNHIKRVHKPHMEEEIAPEEDHSEGMLMDDTGMMQGPSMHANVSPVKKKGRPAKNPEMSQHMHRPIGQVSPAPRSSNEGKEGHEPSRPPVQQDRASPMMQRPGGGHRPMMPGGPKRQPGMGGPPPPGFMGPGMRLRGPAPHHQQYQGGPHMREGVDLKRLGMKLGGSISISSSGEQQQQPIAPSTSRRPMPGPSRMHSSSPKSDPLATSNRPSVSRQSNLSQDAPVEVKQEPMDDMFEEGEELPEDEEDYDEEDYGEEEEEEGYVQEGMNPGEAPYDDDGVEYDDDDGSYHQ